MTHARGFTIVELLVALAIAGVLFSLALPAYNGYVLRSHRADAHGALLDISARQERFMAQNNTYTTEIFGAAGLNMQTTTSSAEFYDMSVSACGTGSIATCYVVTATARGSQVADTECLTITYDSIGQKSGTTTECW
jgi:type IV pilus assembly protein PilE